MKLIYNYYSTNENLSCLKKLENEQYNVELKNVYDEIYMIFIDNKPKITC